jgi:hypothetical protein
MSARFLFGDREVHRVRVADQYSYPAPGFGRIGELLPVTVSYDVAEGQVEQLDTLACICQKVSPVGRITGREQLEALNGRVLGLLVVGHLPRPEHLLRDA